MTATEFNFLRSDKPSKILEYPTPWIVGEPHQGKVTLCPFNKPSERYLCGIKLVDGRIFIGLFPLDANPNTKPAQYFPLIEEVKEEPKAETPFEYNFYSGYFVSDAQNIYPVVKPKESGFYDFCKLTKSNKNEETYSFDISGAFY